MPIINGPLLSSGAVVDVVVGVSQPRMRILRRNGMPIPPPVHVRALIDTGSTVTGFNPSVFNSLGLLPVGKMEILTPSTPFDTPHICDLFHVSLSVVANGSPRYLRDVTAVSADCWHKDEGVGALIGLDILNLCFFQYHGPSQTFTLSF